MTMTHNVSNTTKTEDIEFTAAYGTAVVMTGRRQMTIRRHQQERAVEANGNVSRHPNTATATGRHLGGPQSFQPDDKALNPVEPPARQSIRLAAAPDAGKGRANRRALHSDMDRRRKAA
jgi:hypothetical protein